MADIEQIIERLLRDIRQRESATFTTHTYSDQPIIETGRQMRERAEREGLSIGRRSEHDRVKPGPKPPRSASREGKPSHRQLTLDVRAPLEQGTLPRLHRDVPERYYQLRQLARSQGRPASSSRRGSLAYGSQTANRLFLEQARFMEDFEDEYDYRGTFVQYFPTYSSMTLEQLRGYFSWRTRVRAGQVDEAPLSFAFLYVYELLCGVGTTPGEQGYRNLASFRDAFAGMDAAQGSTFGSYLSTWMHDYVIYHGLDASLLHASEESLPAQAFILLRAEEAHLASLGLARKLSSPTMDAGDVPSDEEVLQALNACSSYQICGARLYKTHPDEVRTIACETFRALVVHCSKRRKTDFVEGIMGAPHAVPYTMFAGAVWCEDDPHADADYVASTAESYLCRGGRWTRRVVCDVKDRSTELGSIMRAVDIRLRASLDYPYPLKDRKVAVYIGKIIDKAIDQLLAARAEEERRRAEKESRRIDIDLSQLAGIRAAAALTQEALLTDEERGEGQGGTFDTSQTTSRDEGPADGPATIAQYGDECGAYDASDARHEPGGTSSSEEAVQIDVQEPRETTASSGLLSPVEHRVLQALLDGTDPSSALEAGDPLLSLVIDALNEKLFDLVGDAVVEYDGDTPSLVEDYEADVREIV